MKAKNIGVTGCISILILLGYGFGSSADHVPVEFEELAKVPHSLRKSFTLLEIRAEWSSPSPAISDYRIVTTPYMEKNYIAFKEALGFKESRSSYSCINSLGYMGKYQFGNATLAVLGIRDTIQFLRSPLLQEAVLKANIARNKWILRHEIASASGKTIKGILITESGLIAAAHLAGPGNVKKYIRSNGMNSVEDAYGTSVEDYVRHFSGYDLSAIKAKQKVKVNGEHYE